MDVLKEFGTAAIMLLIGIIGFFLRQKDEAQGKQISALWLKHDEDAAALADLKERIAREHYVKTELDARFQRLEDAFQQGFQELGSKIDKLSEVLVQHLTKQ